MVKSMIDFYKIPKKIKCEASNLKLKGNENYCAKCSYLELFWSAFFRIRTEWREIFRICPYLDRMREGADQNNSEYEHFLRSGRVMNKKSHQQRRPQSNFKKIAAAPHDFSGKFYNRN